MDNEITGCITNVAAIIVGALGAIIWIFLGLSIEGFNMYWAPTAFAVLVVFVGFEIVRHLVRIDLSRTKVLGSFPSNTAYKVSSPRVTVDEEKALHAYKGHYTLVVIVALCTYAALPAWWFYQWEGGDHLLGWTISTFPGAGIVFAMIWFYPIHNPIGGKMHLSINERVEKVNGMLAGPDEELKKLSALVNEGLQINFPVSDRLQEPREYVKNHGAELLADPNSLEAILKRARKEMREDISRLESALGQFKAAEADQFRASRAVAQNPALLVISNKVDDEIHRARTTLLPSRKWQSFQKAMEISKNVNRIFDGLNGELKKLSTLATDGLQIDFPVSDQLQEPKKYLDNHAEGPLKTLTSLVPMLERAREGIREDIGRLEVALGHLKAAEAAHSRAARAVAQNPALLAATDELHDEIHRARTYLLPAREWQTFREAMEAYREELQEIEAAGAHGGAGGSTGTEREYDPYRVLGANRSMSIKEIRSLYTELINIYHPDKGMVKDGDKFIEIREAWDAIREERGE